MENGTQAGPHRLFHSGLSCRLAVFALFRLTSVYHISFGMSSFLMNIDDFEQYEMKISEI
jgi:hypothetical protein